MKTEAGAIRKLPVLLTASAFLLGGGVLLPVAAQHSWQVIPGVRVGAITPQVSEADLKRIYGRMNVKDTKVELGEGEFEPGTVIYPDDPTKTIKIIWKDAERKRFPKSIYLTGENSLWKTRHGISLGTRLTTLEQINGKPFLLTGFSWDYGGTVVSWEKGSLTLEFEKNGRGLLIRLSDITNHGVSEEEVSTVNGDRDFSSSNRVIQRINPKVRQIIVNFP